jgi:hypothetical protein
MNTRSHRSLTTNSIAFAAAFTEVGQGRSARRRNPDLSTSRQEGLTPVASSVATKATADTGTMTQA